MTVLRSVFLATVLLVAMANTSQAAVITLGFECISENAAADCAILENQIFADVVQVDANSIYVEIYNTGPFASSFTDFYVRDEHDKLDFVSILDGPGVDFEVGASPGDPPGANGFTMGFSADSEPPTQPNGVNPDEWVRFYFDLNPGFDWNDVVANIGVGDLAFAGHVQGFDDGGSVTGTTEPPTTAVPEPATMTMLGLGLVGFAAKARKRKK